MSEKISLDSSESIYIFYISLRIYLQFYRMLIYNILLIFTHDSYDR